MKLIAKCPDCRVFMKPVHRQLNLELYNKALEAYHKRLVEADSLPIFTRAYDKLFPPRINQFWFITYECPTCEWRWTFKD